MDILLDKNFKLAIEKFFKDARTYPNKPVRYEGESDEHFRQRWIDYMSNLS